MGDNVVLLGRDVHYYVGTTPTLINPPVVSDQGIIKTVRGSFQPQCDVRNWRSR